VPGFFVDTSALAKLYHRELGSAYLERLLLNSGTRFWISRLSIVEMESVFAIKVRSGQLDISNLAIARRRLRADLAQKRIFVGPPTTEKHFAEARRLLAQYAVAEGLRTLDSQLAVALDLWQAGLVQTMLAADQRICRVARLGGCPAVDPQVPAQWLPYRHRRLRRSFTPNRPVAAH